MNTILYLILLASNLYACPDITGVFSCTNSRGETDTVYMETTNKNHYSILNENALKPIELVADNEVRTSKEVITDDYGKVIGVIVKNTIAHCPESHQLNFNIQSDNFFNGQKVRETLKSRVKKISEERFETTTEITTIDHKKRKSVTKFNSNCTLN